MGVGRGNNKAGSDRKQMKNKHRDRKSSKHTHTHKETLTQTDTHRQIHRETDTLTHTGTQERIDGEGHTHLVHILTTHCTT